MVIKIDKEKCIGCGTCMALASNTFKFGDDGKAELLPEVGDDADTVKMAADACPTQAITIE